MPKAAHPVKDKFGGAGLRPKPMFAIALAWPESVGVVDGSWDT